MEIIKELPKLTTEERSAVRRRLRELEETGRDAVPAQVCGAMFQDMDKQEARNARRKTR